MKDSEWARGALLRGLDYIAHDPIQRDTREAAGFVVAENQRLREALEKIAATDGDEWYARSVAREALDYAREEVA